MSFWLLRTLGLPFSIPLLLTAPCSCTPIHTPQKRFGKRGTFLEVSFHLKGLRTVSFLSLQLHELYSPWNSPGQNTKVDSLSLLWGSSQPRDRTQVSHIAGGLFTNWTTREAQEYWSEYPIPSPADLPHPGIELGSLALQVDSLPTELWGKDVINPRFDKKKKNKHSLSSGKWLVVTDTDC